MNDDAGKLRKKYTNVVISFFYSEVRKRERKYEVDLSPRLHTPIVKNRYPTPYRRSF